MAWWNSIYTRLQNLLVPIGGTLSLPTGSEEYPIAISNQLNGGSHNYEDVEDIKFIPVGRLSLAMQAICIEKDDIVRYILTSLPEDSDYINGELQDWRTFWTVREVVGEASSVLVDKEYYKLFDISISDDVIDNPDNYKPSTNNPEDEGWSALPINETETTYRFAIKGSFLSDGTLVGEYSDPYLFTFQSSFKDLIVSNGSDDFKKTNGVISPSVIVLTAELYQGEKLLNTGGNVSYSWRRLRSDGTWSLADKTTQSVVITPDDVLGQDVFECTQTFQAITFTEKFTINDISDGIGVVIDAESSVDGYVFKNSNLVDKTITFNLYNNGAIVDVSNISAIFFNLDGTSVSDGSTYNGESVSITDSSIVITSGMVDQKLTIKADFLFNGVTYSRTLDITIVPEAEALVVIYHDSYINPTTGLEEFPSIVEDGTVEDNISPSGTWYVESDINKNTTYLAQKVGSNDFKIIKISGESGNNGNNGPFLADIFTRSISQPSTPLGTITNGPIDIRLNQALPRTVNWYTLDPKTEGSLWKSKALFVDLVANNLYYLVGNWSEPQKVEGVDEIVSYSVADKIFLHQNFI